MRLELFRNSRGRWQLRLKARNGQTWQHSEEYASKSNARRAARSFLAKVCRITFEEVSS